ncbi:L-rhamnose mutarotase [Novosphingobium gossypii]|uniref:L-rhamnose mutarotase n=1 Tax=Novosphingobium gossypii TaxID=1604774 RepID=UPI003D1924FD
MTEILRRCFAVDLVDQPEMIARYRAWHSPGGPPAAVARAIRADGVRDLQIWIVADRLFMIMEQDAEKASDALGEAARDTADPEVAAWDALMRTFQRPLPFAPETTWVEMERIYTLAEQP